MKIENRPAFPAAEITGTGTRSDRGHAGAAGVPAPPVATDRVTLSDDALHQAATPDTTGLPAEPRSELRISGLKQAIADGTYTIDPVRIAEKFSALIT
jgi:anti-sigma28 factor (negative regulator of flagellin synthesis)